MGIRNLADVKRGHEKLLNSTERLFGESLEFAGQHAEQHVKAHAEFKRRTGKLQDTTTHKVVKRGNSRILKIQNPQKYAAFIEYGTKAHGPVTARFLRFRIGNRTVFARRVKGIRPYKFLFNATDAAHRVGGKFMREGMGRISKRF